MKNLTMKKKALLFGTLPVLAIAAGLFFFNSTNDGGVYEPRAAVDMDAAGIDGAYQYYHLLKGDYTKEDWERARQTAQGINKNRADIAWLDLGPDNIGGRTRAIAIDHNNINHVYAGSVSGGLFESINRANTWHKVEEFTSNLAISSICQTPDGTFYVATGHQRELNSGTSNAFDTGANGDGIYKSEPDGSWSKLPGSEFYQWVNEVVCDTISNKVWIAASTGLKIYDPVTNTIDDVDAGLSSGASTALSVSKEGQVIVTAISSGTQTRTFVSSDGGVSFTDYSEEDNTANPMIRTAARIEYAISHEKVDGQYILYASAANSFLQGVFRSGDNGVNWTRIAPGHAGTPDPGSFAPFSSGGNGQGTYDNIITVVPGAPNRIILGGIDCYTWAQGSVNWKKISQWFLDPTSFKYVHADIHDLIWDKWGRLYVGSDGGVSFSENAVVSTNPDFRHANRGFNVTQYYASGFSAHGDVTGGTQDNGVTVNYHAGTTFKEHNRTGGGDGFSASISFINRNLAFGSVYYASIYRSSDRGVNRAPFGPNLNAEYGCTPGSTGGEGCGQFYTVFEMWENPNDVASTDSIFYIPQRSYNAGDEVLVPSFTSQTFIKYETPTDVVYDDTLFFDPSLTEQDTIIVDEITGTDFNLNIVDYEYISGAPSITVGDSLLIIALGDTVIVESLSFADHYYGSNDLKPGQKIDMEDKTELVGVAWDTLHVQDPYQSWFALGLGGGQGVWMTRNALRFSAERENWILVADGIPTVSTMEFSKDGNHLFVGTWNGQLYRLSGFNSVYSPVAGEDTLIDIRETDATQITSFDLIGSFGAPVTGIASGAIDDPDHLVVSLGLFSGANKVRETTIATGDPGAVTGSWTSLGFPAGIPCYSVVIDRDDANRILVGTEFGVYATENGGGSDSDWDDVSGAFGPTPVHDMGQNWRTWDEGCFRPGEIYIGTHGRGIWSTDAYLGTTTPSDNLDKEKFQTNLKLYPNPVVEDATISFELNEIADAIVQVFNLKGQVVREIRRDNLMIGQNQIKIGVNDLSRGTYIVRLNAGSVVETTKFIKR
jgi:hypothetical protein